MLVLGLQGSPRKKGNTHYLLNAFMDEAQKLGAKTHVVDVCNKHGWAIPFNQLTIHNAETTIEAV